MIEHSIRCGLHFGGPEAQATTDSPRVSFSTGTYKAWVDVPPPDPALVNDRSALAKHALHVVL